MRGRITLEGNTMIENRSVPPKSVLPHVLYANVPAAINWLSAKFGFHEHYRYGDPVSGAQVYLGDAFLMLKRSPNGNSSPRQLGYGTQSLTVFVEDVDAHFARAKAEGASIVEELHETIYGERQYGVEDLEGHHWLFSKHARDLSPDEWGARVVSPPPPSEQPRPRFCYMEIPALSVEQSMRFYEKVFGWEIRRRESERPSFDDAPGNISGTWVSGREISSSPGLLPYIWVDDVAATLALLAANGGEVIRNPSPDEPGGTCSIATWRDPAGNALGLYQER
jgi:predicted enzyme related to lactoylglutathione lyase